MQHDRLIVHGPRAPAPTTTESLGELYYRRLQEYGEKVAQVQQVDGRVESRTFSDLLRRGKSITNFFRQKGLGTGDAIMICCFNTLEFAPLMLGTLFLGGSVAPVNPMFDARDMLHFLEVIQPAMVICNPASQEAVTEAVSKCGKNIPVVTMDTIEQVMMDKDEVKEFELGKVEPTSDVAAIMCSSGTSGRPKGVEMIHSRLFQQIAMPIYKSTKGTAVDYQEVAMNIAGPYWVSCLLSTLITLNRGMKLVLLNGFTAETFLDTIQTFKVNAVILGPDQVVALAKRNDLDKYDTSSITSIAVGGAPTPIAMFNALQKKLDVPMTQLYGMTESMALVSPVFDVTNKPGNVGKLVSNVDAKVIDIETGRLVGRDCVGELCFRTPSVMKGYRNNPAATAQVFDQDGFLHTGDVGYFDQDGFLFIQDRIKELIKYKRDHVPPIDIEEVLLSHPDVSEAAVIGVFHEEDWEHATGFVVLKPGATATVTELIKLVEAKLPQFKWLHGGLRLVDSLPRTATGKLQKKTLREMFTKCV